MSQEWSFDRDYDAAGKRTYKIPEFDPDLHIRQMPLWREMKRRIPGVGFNRVWQSAPPDAKLTTKTRGSGNRKYYRVAMYRDRLDELERILREGS